MEDKAQGNRWLTKLPFPVQVIDKTEVYDAVTKRRFASRYRYHHGYFHGPERELRGFGMVEQLDTDAFGEGSVDDTLFPEVEIGDEPVVASATTIACARALAAGVGRCTPRQGTRRWGPAHVARAFASQDDRAGHGEEEDGDTGEGGDKEEDHREKEDRREEEGRRTAAALGG